MRQERLLTILNAPCVTDKSYRVGDANNQVVFKVAKDATKPEIKAAVESLFEVEVEKVQVLNNKGKQRRFGRTLGRTKSVKKAYVTLKPGQDINFIGTES
jgi:large subunit ribosomal protein L23